MAGYKHEAQEIVADHVIQRGIEIGLRRFLLNLEFVAEFLMLAFEQFVAAEDINRPMLRGGHEPSARLVWNTRRRPLCKRGEKRFLRELLGEADIAHHPRETGDQLRLLDPEDRVDRVMGI